MLTQAQRAIITATVPILEQGGEALTRHFYQNLFRDHPEVLPYFNQAHQHSGEQQRALANGVLMYAKHIDQLDALGGLVSVIVNKHVALQIRAEHYPLVGASLLQAIREVLGEEVASDAVIDAWGAAYGQLAEILAGEEGRIYKEKAAAPGGWSGARDFIVQSKIVESAEITSFLMAPADGRPVLDFAPGQYIGVLATVDGVSMRRQYSLSAASNGQTYRISVKREQGGKVSNHFHDHVRAGDTVQLTPPSGDFVLQDGDKPLVLISGGVGITPTLAMLAAALRGKRPVHFIHAARHQGVHAFRQQIDELAARHPQLTRYYCYAEHAGAHDAPDAVGLLSKERLAQWLPASRDVDAYFLGPQPFMRAVKQYLRELGVPEQQTHHEFFGPAAALN
ncbi:MULTISPECIES: NO-inducible flavohemoprotein [unclassified Janthinobacterium]|uniref:NO-inducible flavohemoprotein n=1 Tax=unclassified Janthinobacterium TaxID=2610881 RepID=UPI00088D1C41|nr:MULTISPECIES: NO-inducible flavohemoprotein [unclassified Janthinobacterium]SDA60096.1 nitric oxide dioxygenase [Janthinobacterium sp. 551a]SFB33264.1 nitric oxide dioxygenase [Janthinobacterium sp. 344]